MLTKYENVDFEKMANDELQLIKEVNYKFKNELQGNELTNYDPMTGKIEMITAAEYEMMTAF